MKVLEYGSKGKKIRFRCLNCDSLIELYDTEVEWYDINGETFGVYCPVCKAYDEREVEA